MDTTSTFYQPDPGSMPVPIHSIHSIRNTLNSFTSPTTITATSSSLSHTNILLNLMTKHNAHSARRGSSSPSQSQYSSSVGKRAPGPKPSIRRPYSPRRVPPSSTEEDQDFTLYFAQPSDEQAFNPTRTVIYDTHPSPPTHLRRSSPLSKDPTTRKSSPIHFIPAQIALAPDSESRSKIVAGILLHRVHAVGKPIRQKIVVGHEGPRTYVRSSLSTIMTVDY